ncbi:hypothetical protein [Inquilinus limosus]|uniref:Uncharacterized protein n=1 Tax=Inquilinus limosus MP06 TaxID=1398085 RepID=A0A0A0CXJ1_9PROT|nr:hypothetical protein [Inquilinus limosus]KGM30485.1 hypothetical protein P409_32725 [Inquilinus limosus MP06]
MLAGLTQLALEMARTCQARAAAALAAGDPDRAGKAEARFSSLFLGIRRVVALQARLRRQQEASAATPAPDEAAMLSELVELALELARGFQALGVTADDIDRAADAEIRFSGLFLGIRRAIALQARLRQQREEDRRKAEQRRKDQQDEKDDRRHAVAQGVARAIAAVPDAETQERLTVDLWDRLTEDERIDVDLADTALPIGGLIASLCRSLGLPPGGTPPAGGPAAGGPEDGGAPGADRAGSGPKGQAFGPASHRASSNAGGLIPAEDSGKPEGERRVHTAAGGVFNPDRKPALPSPGDDRPPAGTGPPGAGPPDSAPATDHCG